MRRLRERARSPWIGMRWAVSLVLLASCGEQHEPRAAPIVARRLGGDSLAPGAMIKVCTLEEEACVPTYPVACSLTWGGDSAQKPPMPRLSAKEQAWCAAQGTDARSR
jgi:hypothetical protein